MTKTVDVGTLEWLNGPRITLLPNTRITGSGSGEEFIAGGDVAFSELERLLASAYCSSARGGEPELTLLVEHRDGDEDDWETAATFTITAKGRSAAQLIEAPKSRLRTSWTVTGSSPVFTVNLGISPSATVQAVQLGSGAPSDPPAGFLPFYLDSDDLYVWDGEAWHGPYTT